MPRTAAKNPIIPDFTTKDPNDPAVIAEYLRTFGYHNLLGIKEHEARRIDTASVDHRLMLSKYQAFFMHKQGRDPDGIIGPVTKQFITKPRCACPDVQPAGAAWDDPCRDELLIFCEFPRLKTNSNWPTAEAYENDWYAAFDRIAKHCNIGYKRSDEANAHYYAYDGSTGANVFAWSEFPSSCQGQSESLFGRKWDWGKALWMDTNTHEILHGLGVPHGPDGSIMFWTTSEDDYYGELQDWDIRQVQDRYGKRTTPLPIDPVEPTKLILPVNIRVTDQGIFYGSNGSEPDTPVISDDDEISL